MLRFQRAETVHARGWGGLPSCTLPVIGITAWFMAGGGAALAQRPLGIDVSHWQGTITLANWQQVKNSGRVFAFTKASESTGYVDPTFTSNMTNGRTAGLYMGCYHFARPEVNTANPTAEANHFVNVAGAYLVGGYLRPVLDLETGSGLGKTTLSNWVNAWLDRVEQLTGIEPMIYTNTNYATNYLNSTVSSRTVWIANWGGDPQTGNPGTGVFPTWAFWQYSATGSVPGISGNCDLDVFHGTLAQLQSYVIPSSVVVCSPTALARSTTLGLNAASQSFMVRNGGSGTLNYVIESDSTWLVPTPPSGASTGEWDTITVNYATSTLPMGQYTGTITVSDTNPLVAPQTVTVELTIGPHPADLNADGKVESLDVQIAINCMTGPELGPPGVGCENADLDGDNDVDSSDFATIQRCLNGNLPPIAACVN